MPAEFPESNVSVLSNGLESQNALQTFQKEVYVPPSFAEIQLPFTYDTTQFMTDQSHPSRIMLELKQSVSKDRYCELCGKFWQTTAHLRRHMRTHTGEKPFKCEVCEKAFRQKSHLAGHMQVHLKPDKYATE